MAGSKYLVFNTIIVCVTAWHAVDWVNWSAHGKLNGLA